MTGYRVKDWAEFQHYKDRNPPWIRLHKRLLDNRKFHSLPDDSRALAPMLWLLASESEDIGSGLIAFADEDIAFRLRRSMQEFHKALKPLLDNGFIEREQVASATIAACEQPAVPETEADSEAETKQTLVGDAAERIDFEFFRSSWKEHLPLLPQVEILSDQRKKAIKARWHSELRQDKEMWLALLRRVAASDWMMGRTDKPFTTTFDWVLKPGNMLKIMEGNYDNRTTTTTRNAKPTTLDIIKDGIALARAQREQASPEQVG